MHLAVTSKDYGVFEGAYWREESTRQEETREECLDRRWKLAIIVQSQETADLTSATLCDTVVLSESGEIAAKAM